MEFAIAALIMFGPVTIALIVKVIFHARGKPWHFFWSVMISWASGTALWLALNGAAAPGAVLAPILTVPWAVWWDLRAAAKQRAIETQIQSQKRDLLHSQYPQVPLCPSEYKRLN